MPYPSAPAPRSSIISRTALSRRQCASGSGNGRAAPSSTRGRVRDNDRDAVRAGVLGAAGAGETGANGDGGAACCVCRVAPGRVLRDRAAGTQRGGRGGADLAARTGDACAAEGEEGGDAEE